MGVLTGQIDGVFTTPLKIIESPGGAVMHALKKGDAGFIDFGEVYFSQVKHGAVKAWKRHRRMTLNLVVPVGKVRIVLFDDRQDSPSLGGYQEFILSVDNYNRLTVPPMLWFGFQGLKKGNSTLLNLADLVHDPNEVDNLTTKDLYYDWTKQ